MMVAHCLALGSPCSHSAAADSGGSVVRGGDAVKWISPRAWWKSGAKRVTFNNSFRVFAPWDVAIVPAGSAPSHTSMLSPAEVVLAFGVVADGGATGAGVAGRSSGVGEAES